ncbi:MULTISPECIES: endolytic transglycosylase MltG [unclassified Azospirillum]|uniref:endolytic transglycosylase MltG n=1 Tax=unclassified Azospirillum TaxID=2630922 RepID=UPI001FCCCF25|nr:MULTISPECIES: endolytic transglycosylase MltG [unclassified Azospirillum]
MTEPDSPAPNSPQKQRRPFRWLLWFGVIVLLLSAMAGGAGLYGWQRYTGPGPLVADKALVIPRGSGVAAISRQLAEAGITRHPLELAIAMRLRRDGAGLRAGEYAFPAGISLKAAIELILSGKTVVRRFTVPEGLTAWQIVELLKADPALSGDVAAVPAEGSLLPETYHYSYGDARADLLARMQTDMAKALEKLWAERAPDLPIMSKEQAVILASVVEKETGVAAERPRVAGVFINRLRQGMKLQSDPTIIYALSQGKGSIDRALTRADWKLDSPYNTYMVDGLPVGPIANPGLLSLQAVLKPEANRYLYFVADGTGGHAFAETLDQHNRNVVQWRKVRDGE